MHEKRPYTLELKERQYEYLRQMTEKYHLLDESKAVRCVVNFAIDKPEQEEEIFDETRCLDCH